MGVGAGRPIAQGSGRVLMFSGGRDSTLAAVRLAADRLPISLVTVSSSHLVGIERVKGRLAEIASRLPPDTSWIHVRQPDELRTDTSFYERTCLPCHHAYVVASGVLARVLGASRIAFGYAGYQQDWPEQTPAAVSSLRRVLARHGIALELPVYDLPSKEAAIAELTSLGLSTAALEQKCTVQVTNVVLAEEKLLQQVGLWETAIDRSMIRLSQIKIKVVEQYMVSEFA